MPSPQQNRVLLGLESGRKLHDLLREPGMPSKTMVEEWRGNPEFDAAFEAAAATGKGIREKLTGKAEPLPSAREASARQQPLVKTEVVRPEKRKKRLSFEGPMTGPATKVGTPADLVRITNVQKITAAIGDLDTFVMRGITGSYCLAVDALREDAPVLAPPRPLILPLTLPDSMKEEQQKLQQQVLAKLRAGMPSAQIMKETVGFDGVKLAAWRKNQEFAAAWDAAKAEGRGVAPKASKPLKQLRESQPVASTIPVVVMQPERVEESGFYMVIGQEFRYDTLSEAEEAAQQYAKDTGRRSFVMKTVLEVVPEVVVVSTTSRMIA